jgi:peptidoglycan/xylan/chitin deacetylase (PgdA/CDA1 family)
MSVAGQPAVPDDGRCQRIGIRDVPMILMYHAVAEADDDPNQLCVAPQVFGAQMTWLARRGLRGVSIATLVDAVRSRTHRRMVGITFDDGYMSVLESAVPILQRHRFGATAFVLSERLGGTNEWDDGPSWQLLSADGVRDLIAAGIEIGSHGATHVHLANADQDRLTAEVANSRARLSALAGTEIRGFAYPYGSMDAAARRAVHAAGYQYACAVDAPRAGVSMMALPRIYVGQRDSAARLLAKRVLYKGYVAMKGRLS